MDHLVQDIEIEERCDLFGSVCHSFPGAIEQPVFESRFPSSKWKCNSYHENIGDGRWSAVPGIQGPEIRLSRFLFYADRSQRKILGKICTFHARDDQGI